MTYWFDVKWIARVLNDPAFIIHPFDKNVQFLVRNGNAEDFFSEISAGFLPSTKKNICKFQSESSSRSPEGSTDQGHNFLNQILSHTSSM
jgi:hypothetical protein